MINKIYDKVVEFIKENYLWLIFYVLFIAVMTYPLPFYIYSGGGIINIDSKIELDKETVSKGSYNMSYVSEINATIPTFLLSYVKSDWDLVSKKDVTLSQKETKEDVVNRDKLYLIDSNQSAVLTVFSNLANSNNINYQILDTYFHILYIEESSNTNLKIGDRIIDIDGVNINSLDDITAILDSKQVGDKLIVNVLSNNKEKEKYIYVKEEESKKILGIALIKIYDYKTNPNVKFHFSKNESGPSGGLMLSLALYDKLVSEDITKGLKIAGTGTIDENGKVGSIGGVKYKLKGAVKAKSDVFIVPNGENYDECIKLKEKYNYNIKIIGVDTFNDAIKKLKEI